MREGAVEELQDDEGILRPEHLGLMLLKHLAPDGERDKSFLETCRNGRLDAVEQKLKAQQDHGPSSLALGLAASRGHLEVVRILLEAGAEVDAASNHYRIF